LDGLRARKKPLPDSLEFNKQVDIFDIIQMDGQNSQTTGCCSGERSKEFIIVAHPQTHTPANGFVIGAAVSVTEFLGEPSHTNLSSTLINVSLTTKSQLLMNLKFDVYLPKQQMVYIGNNRLLFFNQDTAAWVSTVEKSDVHT
jgi:hypothetical protein